MSNVVSIDKAREDREREVDEHIERVIDSTIDFIRGSTERSPVLSDIDIITGVWMGLSIELFPRHYRDGSVEADKLVMTMLDELIELVEATNEKQREESTTH